ncbi:MAG: hypothetical protein ACKN89_01185 [Cyanobium sp.]
MPVLAGLALAPVDEGDVVVGDPPDGPRTAARRLFADRFRSDGAAGSLAVVWLAAPGFWANLLSAGAAASAVGTANAAAVSTALASPWLRRSASEMERCGMVVVAAGWRQGWQRWPGAEPRQ